MTGTRILHSTVADMQPATLYAVMRLRVDVFVVEQGCVYRELDGRDLEPGALVVWAEQDDEVVATLRLLAESAGTMRIGRVATAGPARSAGLGRRLIDRALDLAAGQEVILDAQAHLEGWYSSFGFVRSGPDFLDDGICHVPMRRPG